MESNEDGVEFLQVGSYIPYKIKTLPDGTVSLYSGYKNDRDRAEQKKTYRYNRIKNGVSREEAFKKIAAEYNGFRKYAPKWPVINLPSGTK